MTPFTSSLEKSISHLGEVKLLEQIKEWLGEISPQAPFGIGDDCAVFRLQDSAKTMLATMDPVVWQCHFDASTKAYSVGEKLLKRNLSDIAAMGGCQEHALVGLILSPMTAIEWLREFYLGIRDVARKYETHIVGGDISTGPENFFSAHMALYGHAHHPVSLHSANPGDSLWLTGSFGGSMIKKHRDFIPRLKEGQWLAKNMPITSMTDITDGLSKDLVALLSDDSVALIDLSKIPLSTDAIMTAKKTGKLPLYHAFCDGEDFELAFTLDSNISTLDFQTSWWEEFHTQVCCIGNIALRKQSQTERMIHSADGKVIDFGVGYEHFDPNSS